MVTILGGVSTMPDPGGHDVQAVVDELAEQIREELAKPIKGVVAAPRLGVGYWLAGVVGAALCVAAAIGLPLRAERPSASALAPEKVTLYATDACTQRQAAIVAAIGAYTHDHGAAPDDLSDLGSYLTEPPVDPESGAPYLFSHDGDTISLRCPNPELHAPARQLSQPQLADAGSDQ
jgi:hypothetical protein